MSAHRARAYSPPRTPRASTGQVFVTSFDTSTSTQPGRNSVNNVPGRQNVIYEAQPIRKSHDGKTSKTEYAIRPRQDSSAGIENKRPLTVSTKAGSPSRRGSSAVASPREIVSASAVRDEPSRFLQPASSSTHRQGQYHQRHNSTTTTDSSGYSNVSRDKKDRGYHPKVSSGHTSQKQYYPSRSQPRRHQDEEGWSYTGPREQFDRDYPQRIESRKDNSSRKEHSASTYDRDRLPPRRDADALPPPPPPPSASRQLARIEKDDPERYASRSGFESEPDRSNEPPRRRQSLKTPVLHQQHQQRDDGYSSAREEKESRGQHRAREDKYEHEPRRRERHRDTNRDLDRDRDYRRDHDRAPERDRVRDHDRSERLPDTRRKPRSRDPSPERSGFKSIAAGALGSLTTAGALGMLRKDHKDKQAESEADEDREQRPRRRRRHRKYEDASEESDGPERRQSEEQYRRRQQDGSGSETPEDQVSRRERPRRRPRDEDLDQGQREDGDRERERERDGPRRRHRDGENDQEQRPDADHNQRARSSSRARFRDAPPADPVPQTRDLVLANNPAHQSQDLETRTLSPGENEDDRPRRVQLVEPVKDNQDIKPKGILKPARQVPFPEDPNPIREGVAPLKDATKDGVPVNARWTKINRVLVNPEALEKYNERFEEREDYVIVLRVLSREEIQKLAEKTKEIRETREREWKQKLEDRKQQNEDSGNDEDADYTDYADEQEENPPLAIEAGPSMPPMNLRNLQQQPQQQQVHMNQEPAQSIPQRNMPGSLPVADDYYGQNYSQNV